MLNWHLTEFLTLGEVNLEPSLTIPDDALSIKEILDRYARGLPLGGERVPVYNGEELIPDFDRMSTIDRMEWLQSNADYISSLKTELEASKPPVNPQPTPPTPEAAPAASEVV